jgi:hypothetical protein
MLDTTNWASFPFEVDGVQFVSKVDTNGSFYPQLSRMPIQVVNLMNESAVRELIGKASLFSTAELQAELDRVNEGASQALICLA